MAADGLVAPHAGVWIEIVYVGVVLMRGAVAPHAGVWIEIYFRRKRKIIESRSPRGSVD